MLIFALFTILTAVALPTIYATPALLIRTTSLTLIASFTLVANVFYNPAIGSGVSVFSGLLSVTSVANFCIILLLFGGSIAIMPWASGNLPSKGPTNLVQTMQPSIGSYSIFVLFTTCGGCLLILSSDLINLYLAIEIQSFALYILASLYRDSESATHAGLLYFLLGGLSSSLILLGSALIYSYTGHTNLESVINILSVEGVDNLLTGLGPCAIGFTILTIGFLFKITAAPFHNWGPDVYDGVPTIVTTWLAVLPKVSILALLLELSIGLGGGSISIVLDSISYDVWSDLLLITSLLSLLVGTIVGLAQTRIKRLLAYSTISHVGFLLLALSVHSEEGISSYLFYLSQYTVTALNSFLVVLALGYAVRIKKHTTDLSLINELSGLFHHYPLLCLSFAASLFSIAGVPPLVGFFGKQAVLYTALHGGYTFISIIAIVVSVISASYYLRIIRVMHFDNSYISEADSSNTSIGVTSVHSYTISLLTLSIVFFIASPGLILDSASLVASSLFNV